MLVFPLLREIDADLDYLKDAADLPLVRNAKTRKLQHVGAITAADICRQCGCHTNMACNHADHGPCWWVEKATDERGPLCSHCQMENDNELTADEIERPWKEVPA